MKKMSKTSKLTIVTGAAGFIGRNVVDELIATASFQFAGRPSATLGSRLGLSNS